MKKKSWSLWCATALAMLVVGCNKSQNTSASGPQTLRLWVMPNTPKPEQDLQAVLQKFQDEHPQVKIEISVLDWGSAWTRITTAAVSGDGPDIIQLGSTWASSLTDLGALASLDDLQKSMDIVDSFIPPTHQIMKPRTSDHITSLPWFLDVRPLFYRADIFRKAKADPSTMTTWDGFTAGLEKIEQAKIKGDDGVVQPIGFPGKNDWNVVHNFAPWIWGAGGDFLNAAGDSCVLNRPAALQGILYYLSLVRKGLNSTTNLEKNTAQISSDFDAGKLASIFETTTKNVYLNLPPEQGGIGNAEVAKNYQVMEPPVGPEGKVFFMGGSQLALFRTCRNPALAKELLLYLCLNKDAQLAYSKISGFLPASKSALEDPYFLADPKRKVFKEMVGFGRLYPSVPYWGEIETSILMRRLGNLFDIAAGVNGPYSDAAVKTEADALTKEIDEVIRQDFITHPEHKAMLEKGAAAG